MIEGEVEVLEIDALPQQRVTGSPRASDASAGHAAWPGPRGSTGRSEAEPDVLLEAGQIEPGDADGDCEGGPAQQMETR
jgi:hypothetical protein